MEKEMTERLTDAIQQEREHLNRERTDLQKRLAEIDREIEAIEAYEATKAGKAKPRAPTKARARRTRAATPAQNKRRKAQTSICSGLSFFGERTGLRVWAWAPPRYLACG